RLTLLLLPRQTPETRAECPTVRPCPHPCRYNNCYDVVESTGLLRLPFGEDIDDWPRTNCAMDIADTGVGLTLEEVGELLNITRERARQLEERALAVLKRDMRLRRIAEGLE